MYNDSTPIGGSFSSNRGNLVRVSKANPCPHCGKPDWCYAIGELSVCSRDNEPATGWEATSKTDKEGHVFYARPQEKKPARPKQTRYFPYPARDGSQLVRVVRVDDGEGKKKIWQEHWDGSKWQKGLGDVARASIPVYRYQEVQKAIAEGQLIFTVDGEQCADIFWDLGLAATTSFGGMGKFSFTDSGDLQGAAGIVIAPDRDQPGIKDAEKVAQHFLDALWVYCYPESRAWENLPKSQGLDVFDWIQQEKLSADDIKAAIGEKKVFQAPAPTSKPSNLIQHPAVYGVVESPAEEIIDRADKILADELTPTNNLISAIAAAKRAGLSPRDFREILAERQAEQSLDFSILDSISRLKQLHQ
ncbi:MAG: hypothetical protein M3N42_05710, partial [Cyanobacteriota bacterium]|nr:hypothetical protein [Cyanobacteriota bacterium]